MSDLYYYRDNILNKIQQNKDLDKIEDWIRNFYANETEISISFGLFSPKFKTSKDTFLRLIEDKRDYNNKMIDKYLKYSFRKEEVNGDKESE